jgi:hypothetical protein
MNVEIVKRVWVEVVKLVKSDEFELVHSNLVSSRGVDPQASGMALPLLRPESVNHRG